MKHTIFIFHGTGGYPEENWFPWLKKELEKLGHNVIIPHFPHADKPVLKDWLEKFNKYSTFVNEETILIGHSLGGLFSLRVIERLVKPLNAALFVSSPVGVKPIKFYDGDFNFSNGFIFDWAKIRSNAKSFIVFHSDDDPYVSLGNGQELARQLGVDLTFVPNAGHFNKASGYTTFELLLQRLKTDLDLA